MVKKITSTLTPLLPLPCVAQAPSLLEYKHDIVVLFYHPIPTWCHRPLGGDITIVDGDGWAYWKQSYEGTIIKEIGRGGGGCPRNYVKTMMVVARLGEKVVHGGVKVQMWHMLARRLGGMGLKKERGVVPPIPKQLFWNMIRFWNSYFRIWKLYSRIVIRESCPIQE